MKKQGFYRYAPLATILFVAFAIRLYKIGSPLWLDEIYGYRLAKLGFQAIIQNSWTDPHPPLYYLLQWVVSCFGSIKSEIGWRSIPFLSGVLTIAVIGVTVKDINDTFTSILVCLIAHTSCISFDVDNCNHTAQWFQGKMVMDWMAHHEPSGVVLGVCLFNGCRFATCVFRFLQPSACRMVGCFHSSCGLFLEPHTLHAKQPRQRCFETCQF
jgi:hypothetical protein